MEAIRTGFSTQDGTKIFAQYWTPEIETKAVVVQVHGLGEHCGRYQHVAEFFGQYGIALYGYDHRGHGRSEGKRGHVPDYASLMEETRLALSEAAKLFPNVPQILYGHSWGGNIALNFLLRENPKVVAAIVTDPWLKIPPVPAIKEAMGRFVNNIFPSLTQNNGIESKKLCSDAKVVAAYDSDPLVHPQISVRTFVASDEAANYALTNAGKLQIPLLLMHGKGDEITLAAGSEAFSKANPEKVTFKIWDNMLHEIHNEIGQEKVLQAMVDFVMERI